MDGIWIRLDGSGEPGYNGRQRYVLMRMVRMEIGEVPPFTKPVEFELDERVNLFVGPNATGKTTLLQQVLEKFNRSVTEPEPVLSYIKEQPAYLLTGDQCTFARDLDDDGHDGMRAWNIINVPATRVRYGALPKEGGLAVDVKFPKFKGSVADNEDKNFYGASGFSHVLYEDYIHNVVSALYRVIVEGQEYEGNEILYPGVFDDAKHNPDAGKSFGEAMQLAYACSVQICPEVLKGVASLNEHTVKEVEKYGLPALEPHLEYGVRVATKDAGVSSLNMKSLSAGTEGTLWWIRMVAISLLLMNNFDPGWQNRRAPLLIDEIENHLHPTWQRRVIPALLKYFPGLQIFATTHSPFVVAGLKAGQVHILRRGAHGNITASTNTEDIVGWTMDEVLRTFMGVGDPTDDATAAAARELRQLRDAGPSGDEREEEQRQARMQELRRLVDRDLLAGGPMAARRERFEQDFAAALEKYRQSQSLNQDGG